MPLLSLTPKNLAGPGYVLLNIIRAMNIIGLTAVITSSIVIIIKTVMTSQLYFFDGLSHMITAFICVFLIISEIPLFRKYFLTHWPLLSPIHGFVTLGLAMLGIGANILRNLNKPSASKEALGTSIWRSVIASGIVVFALGFVNIIVSYIFCDRAHHVTARQVRAKGDVAISIGIADFPGPHPSTKTIKSVSSTISSIDSSPASSYKSASVIEAAMPAQPVTPTPLQKPHGIPGAYWDFEPPTAVPSRRASPVPSSYYSERGSGNFSGAGLGVPLPTTMLNSQLAYLVRPENAFQPGRK